MVQPRYHNNKIAKSVTGRAMQRIVNGKTTKQMMGAGIVPQKDLNGYLDDLITQGLITRAQGFLIREVKNAKDFQNYCFTELGTGFELPSGELAANRTPETALES